MTTAALMLLAFLAGMTAVEFLIHRPDRADRIATEKRLRTQLASAERDAEVAEQRRLIMQEASESLAATLIRERNTYATAFRGEMQRQTWAELLHPDEPRGEAVVVDFPVASVVPMRGRR